MHIIKKNFWIIFFSIFILSGLLLEYYINIYKRNIDLQTESEKFEIAQFKVNIFYDVNFNNRLLTIEDQGINVFLHSLLRDQLKKNIGSFNINNIEIKISDQVIVDEDNEIIMEDFIYAENNMDNKLLLRITFKSTYPQIEKSLVNIDQLYLSFKDYFTKNFDEDYRKKIINYYQEYYEQNETKGYQDYKLKFNELFLHIQTFKPSTPLSLKINDATELDVLYIFLNNLSDEESSLFLQKTNVLLDFEQQSDDSSDANFVSVPFDRILTSTRVGELEKINFQADVFGKNTFPLITLFFLILSIAIYLFSKVIRYK